MHFSTHIHFNVITLNSAMSEYHTMHRTESITIYDYNIVLNVYCQNQSIRVPLGILCCFEPLIVEYISCR